MNGESYELVRWRSGACAILLLSFGENHPDRRCSNSSGGSGEKIGLFSLLPPSVWKSGSLGVGAGRRDLVDRNGALSPQLFVKFFCGERLGVKKLQQRIF